MTGLGLLVLRLTIAIVCVTHGAHMLFGAFGGEGTGIGDGGLTNTARHFSDLGLNPGYMIAMLAGLTLFAGGILLAAGFLTRYAATALSLYFLIVLWKEHAPWGFFLNRVHVPGVGHGYEYVLTILGALACLIVTGAGEWSLDGRRAATAESRAAGRARLTRHG